MYYILNGTNQIIAIDDNLLKLCGLSHIDELTLKIALDDIKFRLISENILTLTINNRDRQFTISKESLSSMLGDLTLVNVIKEESKEEDDDALNTLNILRQKHKEEVEAQKATLASGLVSDNEEDFSELLLDDTIEDDSSDEEVEETISIDSIIGEAKEESDDSLELDFGLLDEVETPKDEDSSEESLSDFLDLNIDEKIEDTSKESEDDLDLELDLDLGLLDEVETPPTPIEAPIEASDEETLIDSLDLDENIEDVFSKSEDSLDLELGLEDEVETPPTPIEVPIEAPEEETLIDSLDLDEKIEDTSKQSEDSLELDAVEDIPQEIDISIDIEKTSSAIGVSIEDYNTFLNEYIDNALDLEEDIKGDDEAKHLSAIGTIAHLSEVLHIPLIGDIIDKIEPTPSDAQRKQIDLFYDTLSRITTYEGSSEKSVEDISTPKEEEIVTSITEPKDEIEDELFFEDTPKEEEKISPVEVDTPSDDDFMNLFDEPIEKEEEDISPVEVDTASDDDIMDLFNTPVEEKEEDTAPVEIDTASDDDIMDLFNTPVEEKEDVVLSTASSDEVLDLFAENSVESYDTPKEEPKVEPVVEEEPVEEIKEEVIEAPIEEEVVLEPTKKGFGTLDLSDVKPIHFDFQLEEAANDLSLPVELIEEFVNDFIDQAREETEKMLKCYEEGDLDTIQKIGHLLKGTSSNLRIKPLADTLYKIQFCEDSNHLEHFIRDYWGHFLSFEIQINAISH